MAGNESQGQEIYLKLFKGMLDEISGASTDVLVEGANDLLSDGQVRKYFASKRIQPYVYLSGLLNLLGRDMTRENMSNALKSVGITPDEDMIETVLNANNENGVMYIYSIYFLVILGKEPNVKNICDLVKSLGATPNQTLARKELGIYNKKYEKKP